MGKRGGILGALLASACALAPPALADFPYTSGSPSEYRDYRLDAGVVPDDIDRSGSDWKFAATAEGGSPSNGNAQELNGVRGSHLVDANPAVTTAWMRTTGRPDVTIAVLDSGIKWNDAGAMEDIAIKTRLNPGELPTPNHGRSAPLMPGIDCTTYASTDDADGNGIRDLRDWACDTRIDLSDGRRAGPDGMFTPQDVLIAFSDGSDADANGFVDDIVGWDFLDDDNDPYDDVQYGHGTGEAEDSIGQVNNDNGLPGTCANCMAIHLRVGDSFVADVNRFAQATIYAVDNDVLVVQEALGTLNHSALGRRAVEYAYRHGVTVIASAADEAAQHHNWPSTYEHAVVVNSVVKYHETLTNNGSYLQFNGCTNFMTRITVAIPSTSCSSNATGLAAGQAGIIYSAALNAQEEGDLDPSGGACRRVGGDECVITPNEVRQLMASGEMEPGDPDANSPDTVGFADDIDFTGPGASCTPVPLPGCTDPNRNFPAAQMPPIPSPVATTRRYPARDGFDEFFGYGRLNMVKGVDAILAGRIPPEAELTSPAWYEQVDPRDDSFDVRGEMWARGSSYTCRVEVAPGSEPNNDADFEEVPSVCSAGARTAAFDGVVANIDVAALKDRFPPGTDFEGGAPPPQSNTVPDGNPHQNNRPNQEPFGFTVRLVVETADGPATLRGQDRRNLYLHRDADLLEAFPKQLASDGASSPALADLDGDNRNELVLGTSDGRVHAYDRDGGELPGWPVTTDPLPLHTGGRAFTSGAVSPDLTRGAVLASPAVGDIDHDGAPEVVAADLEGKVYVWNAAGELRWKREANIAYSGKPLAPFENVRRGHRYRTQHGFIGSPVLADLDGSGDGRLEVIAAGMDRHVYAWHPGGAAVGGFPVLVVDRDKITAVDPDTHAPTFKPEAEIGEALNQGAIVHTPALADLDGDERPEIVVGTNEEYPAPQDGGLNSGATAPSGALLDLLQDAIGLGPGNSRLYALKPSGDPGAVSLDNSIFLWKFRVGLLLTELLPVVGEGVTGAPIAGRVTCAEDPDPETPKVGVMPGAGYAYLLTDDGTSCYGQTGGKDNPLASDNFGPGSVGYDHPAIAAVGHPAFGRIDPTGNATFVAPVAGLVRALDLAINEYQGGQDMVGGWNTETGQFRPGFPSPVNDLQFLTGPSTADIDGAPGEEVLAGTASMDLNALNGAGAPAEPGRWPKFTADWMVANPAIGSFGQDETDAGSRQAVIAATRAGTLFAYETDAPTCSPASWPRFHHDNANSGNLDRDAVSPGRPYDMRATVDQLAFKAPGDDLLCGDADLYELVTSDEPIAADLAGARPLEAPDPVEPGGEQRLDIPSDAGRFVAVRAVDEQGNVGRAIVLDRSSGSVGPPRAPAAPGAGGRTCSDRARPRTTLRRRWVRAGRRGIRLRGRSRDRGCGGSVKATRVSVARLSGRKCRFLTRRRGLTRRRSCRSPVFMRARGTGSWRLRVRRRLPRGRYRAVALALDAAGNRERPRARNKVSFRIR